MKKLRMITAVFAASAILAAMPLFAASAEGYSYEIAEENDLASWRYDWNTVEIGSGKTGFESGNLKMENINQGTANYALYKTNKFNEFQLDFYANLYLPSPSDTGKDGTDYANLYLTFYIDFDDASLVENAAMAACPWTMNKGWFSVCFERIQGYSKIQFLVNETFDGHGETRYFLDKDCVTASTDWCDNKYHWFRITAQSTRTADFATSGCTYTVYIDGEKEAETFLCDRIYSNTNLAWEEVRFSEKKGYFGFWASSGYGMGMGTAETGAMADIKNLSVTSFDGGNDTPYPRSAMPVANISANNSFSPEASYETGEDIEIRLADLFEYDGEDKLTYTASYNGEPIGEIKNNYFVWNPTEEGVYDIDFTAVTADDLSAANKVRLRVVKGAAPVQPAESSDKASEKTSKKGCGLSVSAGFSGIIVLAVFVLRKKRA